MSQFISLGATNFLHNFFFHVLNILVDQQALVAAGVEMEDAEKELLKGHVCIHIIIYVLLLKYKLTNRRNTPSKYAYLDINVRNKAYST